MSEPARVGLLDTSVIIDLALLAPELLPRRPRVSVITLAELALGLHTTDDASELAARTELLQQVEDGFDPLPFSIAEARRFRTCVGLVVAIGRSPRPRRQDLMIAATASIRGLPLYTRNSDDFRGLESVLTVVAV